MKLLSLTIVILLSTFSASFVLASEFRESDLDIKTLRLENLDCRGLELPAGATRVVYSGKHQGDTYLNITNVNVWGIPATQQAKVVGAYQLSEVWVLQLQPMVFSAKIEIVFERDSNDVLLRIGRVSRANLKCITPMNNPF